MSVSLIGAGPVLVDELCGAYEFGSECVALSAASPDVLAALRRILRPPKLEAPVSTASTIVALRSGLDGWHLEVDGSVVRGLARSTPSPRVAEELIAAACAAAARKGSSILVRGAVLAKGDVTIALVGDDWDSAKVLGFHLHARGWAFISLGYAFVSSTSLRVIGLPALASVSSSAIDRIPQRYRAAIEASLWYYSGFDVTFYTVDPLLVHPRAATEAVLTHVVIMDRELETSQSFGTERGPIEMDALGRHPLASSLQVARLTVGTPIATCGAVESWALESNV